MPFLLFEYGKLDTSLNIPRDNLDYGELRLNHKRNKSQQNNLFLTIQIYLSAFCESFVSFVVQCFIMVK
jgi:hypothetical protein